MLYNNQNQQVNVPKQFKSVEHPHIFAQLREKYEFLMYKQAKFFRLEERAHIKS